MFEMADDLIIPTADSIISPAIDKLYEKRPNAFPHVNLRSGVYWHPILGFRAQASKVLARLTSLAASRRLNTATGQELLDYVASEFDALPNTDPSLAVGHVVIGRVDPSITPGGVYPKGSRVTRVAYDSFGVTIEAAEYETLTDARMDVGSTATLTIPIQATREGAHANAPILVGASSNANVTIENRIENIEVKSFQVGGGANEPDDVFVRRFAQTYAIGQYGPTFQGTILGALLAPGVRHCLVYDIPSTGTQRILVADESWGSSDRWAAQVQQSIYDDDLVGFGCKISVGSVRNKVISVLANVSLRDSNFLTETTEIDVAIQSAVRAYFDDRLDWNMWNTSALQSAISRAHPKVLSCTSVTVKNAVDNTTLNQILTPDYTAEQFHYYLASNTAKITYSGPV